MRKLDIQKREGKIPSLSKRKKKSYSQREFKYIITWSHIKWIRFRHEQETNQWQNANKSAYRSCQTIRICLKGVGGGHSGAEGRERHRNKDGVTSTRNTLCLTRTQRLRAVSGIVQHVVGSIYIKPCSISRGIRQQVLQGRQLQRGPLHRADTADWMHSYTSPSLTHRTRLLDAFRVKAVPRTMYQSCSHYPWTRSQHVPDKFALFIHMDLSALRPPPKISPWTLHTSPVIQHLNI